MGGALTSVADGIVEIDREENKLEQATAHLEILDQIQDIEEVESEHGKKRLEWYLQRLRKLNGDIEDGSANAMILSLPWESIGSPEVAREVKKSVFSLGYD
jgi:hypothetical protein